MLNHLDNKAGAGVRVKTLREEKAAIEKRLEQLGYDGDCAYEKAMVAFYSERLGDCCRQLSELESANLN